MFMISSTTSPSYIRTISKQQLVDKKEIRSVAICLCCDRNQNFVICRNCGSGNKFPESTYVTVNFPLLGISCIIKNRLMSHFEQDERSDHIASSGIHAYKYIELSVQIQGRLEKLNYDLQ